MSNRPLLFLLEPSFPDPGVGPGLFFCPHCATVEGILAYYPAVRERLDVRHVAFQRPRAAVIEVLGPEHQACPALVLPPDWTESRAPCRRAHGRIFFVGAGEIAAFLAEWAGIALPHP